MALASEPPPEPAPDPGATSAPGPLAGIDPEPGAGHAAGDITAELAALLIEHIFEAGLQLSSASSLVGNGPAGDRLAAAVTRLDLVIQEIRRAVFARLAPPGGSGGPERPAPGAPGPG